MISLERMAQIRDDSPNQETRVYLAALEYIAEGLYVVPLVKNSKKMPPRDTHINYGSATTKREVVERWFNPVDGRFAGWNIGIACGREGGAFAVDIDVHGEANGFAELEEFESQWGTLPEGPVARTPSGGEHRLYRWQAFAASSTGKIARGIDTRGGTDNACKGHIVAFPSIVDGKMYEWIKGGDVGPVPASIMTAMGVSADPRLAARASGGGKGRGNEHVSEADVEEKVSLEQIETMLDFVDPDNLSYDRWLRVGQAINSQHWGDEGLDLWDRWSRKGKRYKKGECRVRWAGFSPDGNVRVGTIFYLAKEGGWTPAPEDSKPGKWDDIIEAMNARYAMVMVGGKIKILREKETPDAIIEGFDLMHREDFKTLCSNQNHAFVNPNTGNITLKSEAEIWLAHENRRTYPNGIGLFPSGAPLGWYNTWCGWPYSPDDSGDCSLFLNHILEVICSGNKELYNWVVDWMADGIQDPENPKGTAIVMKGEEGTGKGTLADTYGRLFGAHYRHLIDDHHLIGNFNAHLMNALMVFADEIIWGGNKKAAGKLKGLVTERFIIGERKGVDAVTMRNMIRLMIASNEDWVIPAGPQSRRWLVLQVNDSRRQDHAYFGQIRDQLKNGGMNKLMHFLLHRKVESNLSRAPHTSALEEQRSLHQLAHSPMQWWGEVLSNRDIGIPDEDRPYDEQEGWPAMVNRDLLFDSYRAWCNMYSIKPVFKSQWEKEMKRYGLAVKRIGNTNRVWAIDTLSWARCVMYFQQATGITLQIEKDEDDE